MPRVKALSGTSFEKKINKFFLNSEVLKACIIPDLTLKCFKQHLTFDNKLLLFLLLDLIVESSILLYVENWLLGMFIDLLTY